MGISSLNSAILYIVSLYIFCHLKRPQEVKRSKLSKYMKYLRENAINCPRCTLNLQQLSPSNKKNIMPHIVYMQSHTYRNP